MYAREGGCWQATIFQLSIPSIIYNVNSAHREAGLRTNKRKGERASGTPLKLYVVLALNRHHTKGLVIHAGRLYYQNIEVGISFWNSLSIVIMIHEQ